MTERLLSNLSASLGERIKTDTGARLFFKTKHLISKNSLLSIGDDMTDVVKVTSKGQITLPVDIRNALDISDASYLVVEQVGDYVLMKKAEIRMKEIQTILKNEAKRKKISKKDLLKALEKSESRTWTS